MTSATDAPISRSRIAIDSNVPDWASPLEEVYAAAEGRRDAIPWDQGAPCPAVVEWLNTEASHVLRPGSRAVVVGCGLGDDVDELTMRGYDAFGIDACPSAIHWARREHPNLSDKLLNEDLLNLHSRWRGRFDLVIASSLLETIDPHIRPDAVAGAASLVRSRGSVIVSSDAAAPDAIAPDTLETMFNDAGLRLARPVEHLDLNGRQRLRAVFHR